TACKIRALIQALNQFTDTFAGAFFAFNNYPVTAVIGHPTNGTGGIIVSARRVALRYLGGVEVLQHGDNVADPGFFQLDDFQLFTAGAVEAVNNLFDAENIVGMVGNN